MSAGTIASVLSAGGRNLVLGTPMSRQQGWLTVAAVACVAAALAAQRVTSSS
jgi:hypothetical protein